MREHDRVVGGERFELVRRADERQTRERGDLGGNKLGELRLGIEAGADRGAALGERIELLERRLHPCTSQFHLRRVAGELLPEGQRRCILRVGASDLDDAREILGLLLQRRLQMRQRRQQAVRDLLRRRDMHRGRKAVVR